MNLETVKIQIKKYAEDIETGETYPVIYFEDDFVIFLDNEGITHKLMMEQDAPKT